MSHFIKAKKTCLAITVEEMTISKVINVTIGKLYYKIFNIYDFLLVDY